MNRSEAAQTLVALALFLPLVLLPVVAYAVQATLLASRASLLQAAASVAAEDASQAIDVGALRSRGVLRLDSVEATRIVRASLAEGDPSAQLDGVAVGPVSVTVSAHDRIPLDFGGILRAGSVTLTTVAVARLTAGYGSPGPGS
jgi:hypothetical protein